MKHVNVEVSKRSAVKKSTVRKDLVFKRALCMHAASLLNQFPDIRQCFGSLGRHFLSCNIPTTNQKRRSVIKIVWLSFLRQFSKCMDRRGT